MENVAFIAVTILGILAIASVVWALMTPSLVARVASATAPPPAPPEPTAGVEPRCLDCRHFDLEEGQEAIRQHPPFAAAIAHISMAKMAAPIVGHDDHGNPVHGKSPVPMKARWDQVGACLCPAPDARDEDGNPVLKWGGDSCMHFEKRRLPVAQ